MTVAPPSNSNASMFVSTCLYWLCSAWSAVGMHCSSCLLSRMQLVSSLTWVIYQRYYSCPQSLRTLSCLYLRLGALRGQRIGFVFSSSVQGQRDLLRCPVAQPNLFFKCSERFRTVLAGPLAICRMSGRHVCGRTTQHGSARRPKRRRRNCWSALGSWVEVGGNTAPI